MTDVNVARVVIGLVVAMAIIIVSVTKTKIHVFPAMIIGALAAGLVAGIAPADVIANIISGFGGTIGSIGIIIGFGVMMGAIFEVSGAAKRMALTFIKMLGKGKEDIAMGITGFIVSIPVFCDSAFVVLSPLAKSLSRNTGKSLIRISCALGAALLVTHSRITSYNVCYTKLLRVYVRGRGTGTRDLAHHVARPRAVRLGYESYNFV